MLLLAASVSASDPRAPILGSPSPSLRGGPWINSKPLAPADLRGKVVLVEFWTFGCINCIRTVPAMRSLSGTYGSEDVVIVGVHTPEFETERDPSQVKEAVKRLRVDYPVVMDNEHAIWRGFRNRYWPAIYVVDRRGVIRHAHVGELHRGTERWERLVAVIEELRRERIE